MIKTTYKLKSDTCGWPKGTIVTKCEKDPSPSHGLKLVECTVKGDFKHGSEGLNSQPEGIWGAWVENKHLDIHTEDNKGKIEYKESKPTSKVNVIRQRLTISDIEVGETFISHGKPEVVYVKISNSHCFNLSAMQMHATTAERFNDLLNIVKVNMVILNGK